MAFTRQHNYRLLFRMLNFTIGTPPPSVCLSSLVPSKICICRQKRSPHLNSSLLLGALGRSRRHQLVLDRSVTPGEEEEGEGKVEKLTVPVPSDFNVILAVKPPGIKLRLEG